MVNPLSRVAMKNILEKDNNNHTSKVMINKNVKTLNDFSKSKDVKKERTTRNIDYSYNKFNTKKISKNTNKKTDKTINELIKNVINGEVKIKEKSSKNIPISLEAAAEIIKK